MSICDIKGFPTKKVLPEILLDNVTEKMIQKSFDELAKGKTTIMIAHRLTTIQNADEIIVLGKEGIIEKGSHDELMSINGTYSKMYKNGQNLES